MLFELLFRKLLSPDLISGGRLVSESGWQIPSVMAKGAGRRRENIGPRKKTFGGEKERGSWMYGRKAGRRRRVRRGLEIDLEGLGFTFPFLNDMQEV